jgi:hypothetical protein
VASMLLTVAAKVLAVVWAVLSSGMNLVSSTTAAAKSKSPQQKFLNRIAALNIPEPLLFGQGCTGQDPPRSAYVGGIDDKQQFRGCDSLTLLVQGIYQGAGQ